MPTLTLIQYKHRNKLTVPSYIREVIFDSTLATHDLNFSCTSLITDIAYDFEWVPLNCNRVFEEVYFMCEFESDLSTNSNDTQMIRLSRHCRLSFTYFNSVCIRLVHTFHLKSHRVDLEQGKTNKMICTVS